MTFLTIFITLIVLLFGMGIFFSCRDHASHFEILELEKIDDETYRVHAHYHKWFSNYSPTTYICEKYAYEGQKCNRTIVRELETGEPIQREYKWELLNAMDTYFSTEQAEREKAEFLEKFKSTVIPVKS